MKNIFLTIVICIGNAIVFIDQASLSVLIPLSSRFFNINPQYSYILAPDYYFFFLISCLGALFFYDRKQPYNVYNTGFVLYACGCFTSLSGIQIKSFTLFLTGRGLMGLGTGYIAAGNISLVGKFFSEEKIPKIVGLGINIGALFFALTPVAFSKLYEYNTLDYMFVILGISVLTAVIILHIFPQRLINITGTNSLINRYKQTLSKNLDIFIVILIFQLPITAIFFIGYWLISSFHITEYQVGYYLLPAFVPAILLSFMTGFTMQYIDKVRMMRICIILNMLAMLLIFLSGKNISGSPWLFLLGLTIYGTGTAIFIPVSVTYLLLSNKTTWSGFISSLNNIARTTGYLVFTSLSAIYFYLNNSRYAFDIYLGIIIFILSIAIILVHRIEKRSLCG